MQRKESSPFTLWFQRKKINTVCGYSITWAASEVTSVGDTWHKKILYQLQVQEPVYSTFGFIVCFLSSHHKRTESIKRTERETLLFTLCVQKCISRCDQLTVSVHTSMLPTSPQDKSQRFLQVTCTTSLKRHFNYLAVMCFLKRTFHVHSSLFHLFKLYTPPLKPTAALMKLNWC